jgi:hypothetical protein
MASRGSACALQAGPREVIDRSGHQYRQLFVVKRHDRGSPTQTGTGISTSVNLRPSISARRPPPNPWSPGFGRTRTNGRKARHGEINRREQTDGSAATPCVGLLQRGNMPRRINARGSATQKARLSTGVRTRA